MCTQLLSPNQGSQVHSQHGSSGAVVALSVYTLEWRLFMNHHTTNTTKSRKFTNVCHISSGKKNCHWWKVAFCKPKYIWIMKLFTSFILTVRNQEQTCLFFGSPRQLVPFLTPVSFMHARTTYIQLLYHS
jgi:hypothetical protein